MTAAETRRSDLPARADLAWPWDMFAALRRPLQFYATEIHGVSMRSAWVSAAINTAIYVAFVCLLMIIDTNGDPPARLMWAVAAIPLAVLVVIGGLSIVLAPGMAGAPTFRRAWLRALRVATTVTHVLPPAVALATALNVLPALVFTRVVVTVWGFLDSAVLGVFSPLLVLTPLWALVMVLLALVTDQPLETPADDAGPGERRCQRCGYLLRVATDGLCPDCGFSLGASVDAFRHRMSPLELAPSIGSAVTTWLRALVLPGRFWAKTRVHAESAAARNAVVFAALAAVPVIVAVGAAVLTLTHGDGLLEVLAAAVIVGLISVCVSALVLMANLAVILAGIAASQMAGSRLRFDELARIGMHAVGLPLLIEGPLATVMVLTALGGPGGAGSQVVIGGTLAGALLALWSLGSMLRGASVAAWANY